MPMTALGIWFALRKLVSAERLLGHLNLTRSDETDEQTGLSRERPSPGVRPATSS